MTLSSLSSTQRTAPQENFDTDKMRTLIAEYLGIDVRRVTDEAHFSDELGADWLDRLELMILIEDEFAGVEITDDDADQIEVVGDLIRHIEITNNEQRTVKSCRNAGPVFRRFSRRRSTGTVWHSR
jgi:acyl carrier protein